MSYLARPYHIPCDVRQVIPYTMWCPPGNSIYHAMAARPFHIPCHAYQDILYTMPSPMPYLPGHNHIPCDAHQAIPYTMPCIVRPYHLLCHAHQAIPFPMPCHIIYHAMPIRPCHIPTTANDYSGKLYHLSKGANGLVTRCTIACK